MKYEQLHAIVGALKNETAIMRARALVQHSIDCCARGDEAVLADDIATAEIYYRSVGFARARAAQLNREIEP